MIPKYRSTRSLLRFAVLSLTSTWLSTQVMAFHRLFDLPPEIRMMIHHEAMNLEQCFKGEQLYGSKHEMDISWQSNTNPLLLTCKRIHSETMSIPGAVPVRVQICAIEDLYSHVLQVLFRMIQDTIKPLRHLELSFMTFISTFPMRSVRCWTGYRGPAYISRDVSRSKWSLSAPA